MSANAIASGSAILTANADGLASGLGKANHDLTQWGHTTGANMKSSLASGVGGGGLLGGLLKGGAIGVGLAAGQAAIQSIGGFIDTAIGKFHSLGESIDRASKQARLLGTDMATFQGLEHAADLSGVSVEELEVGLGKFRRLVSGPLDTALYDFAKRLEGVQDPGERARLLVENFGKSGLKLGAMFEGGEAGLKDMVEEAKRLGIALSDADGLKIEEANDSISRAKRSIDGLWNKVVVALAPAFDWVGKTIVNIMTRAQPVFDGIAKGFEIAGAIMTAIFDEVGSVLQSALDQLGEWGTAWPSIQEIVVGAFRALVVSAAFFWDCLKLGMSPFATVTGFIVEGLGKVVNAFKDTVKGVLEIIAKIPPIISPMSLVARAALKDFDNLGNNLEKTGKGMQEWGKKAWSDFGRNAKDAGDWFDRLLKKPVEKPVKITPMPSAESEIWKPLKLAGAVEKGTKEAYSAEMRFRYGEFAKPENNVHKENGKKLDKGNAELKNIGSMLKGLETKLADAEVI